MEEQVYTLAQAATQLGIREDSLGLLLPDVGIDLIGRPAPTLTQSEVDRLTRAMQTIHALHHEGPSGGLEE